jgi:hypothetical protein
MPYQALATGPISFLDDNSAQQEIPLSDIYFDANGPNASKWLSLGTNSSNAALVNALLAQLAAQNLLTPGAQATPTPALAITATEAGATGNVIQVAISNVNTSAGTMSMLVTATEVYAALTTATIATALGTTAATANGLVYLQSNDNQPPAAVSNQPLGAALAYTVPQAANAADTAFVLAATDAGDAADAANISISVAPDPLPATTFTLTASWNKTANDVTLAMLTTAATNPFSLLVTFNGPADGPLPAAGTVTLQGGAGATSSPAVAATANVLSS